MQLIPHSQKVTFNKQTDYRGQFIIEPLFPGYGITIGNALRRVLISSIPGSAITAVRINGVDHEFSSLDYVKEDVVDILLNIKQVNLSVNENIDANDPLKITLNKTGEGKVTAGDFECPSQVKIANPNLVLATLTDKAAKMEMECYVENGLGYLPVEERDSSKLEVGYLAVDAIFTPINHVNVENEHVRVGEMTNWDKLILDLETNGTVTCQQAFDLAVNILRNQFSALTNSNIGLDAEQVEQKEILAGTESISQGNNLDKEKSNSQDDNIDEQTNNTNNKSVDESKAEEHKKKRGRPSSKV